MTDLPPPSKLRPCSDCGHQMSPKSWACPGCGSPNTSKFLRVAVYALVLLILLLLIEK